MKSKIELNIDVSDPFKTVLTNSSGDFFTFTNNQHEGFCDFLQGAEKLPIKRVVKPCDHQWIERHSGHCRDCIKCGRQE